MKNSALLRWFVLLQKRLLTDKSFLWILVLIPVFVLALQIVSAGESGIVHIALAMENPADATAQEICASLTENRGIVRFTEADSPEQAVQLVENGDCDGAWIFPENTDTAIRNFALRTRSDAAVVTAVQREENVILRLAREKLHGVLYAYCSYALYDGYLTEEIPEAAVLSEEEGRNFYDSILPETELFRFVYTDGTTPAGEGNYLLSPVRGFLAIVMVTGTLAVSMLYGKDRQRGAFVWLPARKQSGYAFLYTAAAVMDMGILVCAALFISGMAVSPGRECGIMVLYILCCCGFGMSMRLITRHLPVLGACIPLLTILMAVVCPVFFHLKAFAWLGVVFPPYLYILSAYDSRYIIGMVVYAVVVFCLYTILHKLKKQV